MTHPIPTGTASCPICRDPFTATQPQHRYCSERCRKTAWRRRHARSGDQDAVPHPRGVPTVVPRRVPRPRDVPTVAAASPETAPPTRCPHCGGQIAVISLLVAPAAAHVTAPDSHHDH